MIGGIFLGALLMCAFILVYAVGKAAGRAEREENDL